MALILTSLMGLAGSGIDYGMIVIESSRLQNALDASSLAGARALVVSTGANQTVRNADGQAAAVTYLDLHGYVASQNGATFAYAPSSSDGTVGANNDTMQVTGTVVKPTTFWKVIGIKSSTLTRISTAVASGGMVDVMLSLDLSRSMDLNERGTSCTATSTDDICRLQQAVVAFINKMQIDAANPRGTQIGIARWAGVKCSWWRGHSGGSNNQGADSDSRIDWGLGPPGSGTHPNERTEYTTPCANDATVVQKLTMNKATLLEIADNSSNGTCPAGMSPYVCPLQAYSLPISQIPVVYGTPTTATGVEGNDNVRYGGRNYDVDHNWFGITGTRLPAAVQVVSNDSFYAWSTANGGRNDPATTGIARKVLVIMTDGFSQMTYDEPSNPPDVSTWDNEAISLAQTLKLGPDGIVGTTDDVEIYVIGFFPVPYVNSTADTNWARSRAAGIGTVSAGTHPCPAAIVPTAASNTFSYASNSVAPGVDAILNSIASSKPGSCDHYYPIAKSEGASLPRLFSVIAGSIARGRLQ